MEDTFLQVLKYLSPLGYYARSQKEVDVLNTMVSKNLIEKKPGTKRVYQLSPILSKSKDIDSTTFKTLLNEEFKKLKTNVNPFVSIPVIREKMERIHGLTDHEFNVFILDLYSHHEIELEQSLTGDEGMTKGIKHENGKYFQYILEIA